MSNSKGGCLTGTPWNYSSERPRLVTAEADPVAAFLAAHEARDPVALATSGTSGRQRAVVRTTVSWLDSHPAVERLTGLGAASRVWVPGPLTATMNLFAAVHAAVLGASLVGSAPEASHAFLTPAVLGRLDAPDLRGLTVVVAGDRLPPAATERASAAGARVHHYYGAAELSFVAWGSHADDLEPFPGVDVEVRQGEVWVRTPYLCLGYDGPPGPLRTEDDWATVGDRGTRTGMRLVVAGRPDAVTVGGATVEPAEVETVLRGAASGDLAVVGVTHPGLGRLLAVALTDERDLAGVRATARERLHGAQRPRQWFHVPVLPATAAGKPDREALVSLLSREGGPATRLH